MKNIIAISFALLFSLNISAAKKSKVTPLQFNPEHGENIGHKTKRIK